MYDLLEVMRGYDNLGAAINWFQKNPYAIPVLGSTFRSIDQYADYQRMQADFAKNTGRKILYPSIRGYDAQAQSAAGRAVDDVVGIVGKTVKSII